MERVVIQGKTRYRLKTKSIMELVDYHHHHRHHHHPNCNALHAFLYLLAVERVLYLVDRG
jgi:hypothetical protein